MSVAKAKRLMTGKEYAEAIREVGLSQVKAGVFLGLSARTSRRIVANEADIPDAAAKLLRVMIKKKLSVDDVNKIGGEA